jgi:hypothetical protein
VHTANKTPLPEQPRYHVPRGKPIGLGGIYADRQATVLLPELQCRLSNRQSRSQTGNGRSRSQMSCLQCSIAGPRWKFRSQILHAAKGSRSYPKVEAPITPIVAYDQIALSPSKELLTVPRRGQIIWRQVFLHDRERRVEPVRGSAPGRDGPQPLAGCADAQRLARIGRQGRAPRCRAWRSGS